MRLIDLSGDYVRLEMTHPEARKAFVVIETLLQDAKMGVEVRQALELYSGILELAMSAVEKSNDLRQAQYELDQIKRVVETVMPGTSNSTTTNENHVIEFSKYLRPRETS